MHRFFIAPENHVDDLVYIKGSDVHHIKDVLRLKCGDKIIAVDASGAEHEVQIASTTDDMITASILSTKAPSPPTVSIGLLQGVPKGTKFDFVVAKAVELGVNHVYPVIMERSLAKPGNKRTQRWRRVAEAAAKQCRRSDLPTVDETLTTERAVELVRSYDAAVLFWESAGESPANGLAWLKKFKGRSLALIIGPEGGLSAVEVEAFTAAGARPASLGPRILRTETAPIVALAVINHLLGR